MINPLAVKTCHKHNTTSKKFIPIFYIIYDIIDGEGLLYLVNRYHFMELWIS